MTLEPIDTEDDVEFTNKEVKNAVQDMGDKKTPGGDGTPNVGVCVCVCVCGNIHDFVV